MGKKEAKKLLFIYNANSGKGNAFLDSMNKIFSAQTYNCKLCELTYGVFTENRAWKRFRKEAEEQFVFLHKDEFAKEYKSKFGYKFTFPIVLIEDENGLEVFISTNKLNKINTVKELIELVSSYKN